jgi:hypothetical protein
MDEVKSYLNDIRYYSGYLDSTMKATVGREIYYYYFGEYYRCTGNRDSAEYFFRKELEEASDYNNQNAAARGLSQLYNESGQNDSATKYALYSYAMNDSVYAQMSIQSVAQALSSFNYNRNKELAAKEGVRAEKEHARSRRLLFAIFLILTIVILVYLRQRRKSMVQSAKYRAAVIERNKLRKEIESLTVKDYDTIIARKEREIAELNKTIEQQGTMHRQVMANDKLSVFEKSAVVQVFKDKRTYHKGQEAVSNDEWKALVSQFRSDMPSASSSMSSLSPLQLHVCILLLLGFEEGEIALVCQTRPQVITNAKARANQKLFLLNDSASLKGNLTNLIAS